MRKTALICAVLLVATLAAYWNSFSVPLVFDDLATIQSNTKVRFGEFGAALITPRAILYKTFTLNSIWSGQEVWSYHVINFILHFLNGLLLFVIARKILSVPYAALAAAFFLLHPVQTESVTYISSRSELLSTFFYLSGFVVFLLWPAQRRGFVCSLAAGVPYFFGIGSKETVVTLPATICLYDYLFLSNGEFKPVLSRWRFYITYVAGASAAIYYLLTIGLKETIGNKMPGTLSSWHYFLTQTRVLVEYVRLIILPVGLNLDYDFRPSLTLFEPAVILSILFLTGMVFLAFWLRRRAPVFSFSILWFFITLSPTSSFVPINDVIFEHRLYLPLVGVSLSVPLLIELLYRKVRRAAAPRPVVAFCCILLAALLVGTVMRNYVWGDEVRLFTDVVAKSPGKERPYNALAFAYFKRGDFEGGIAAIEQALQKVPNKSVDLLATLANLCLKAGRYERAIDLLQKATQASEGDRAAAYNDLGVAYQYVWTDMQNHRNEMTAAEFESRKEKLLKPSAEAFLKALEIDPDMLNARDAYINVMSDAGRSNEVAAAAEERLKQKETFEDLYTVGKVAWNNGDYKTADAYFERAEKLRDDVRLVYFNQAYALDQLQQSDRAIEKYIQAIRIDPIFSEAHHNLGLIYMKRREYAKAHDAFIEVLRLDPRNVYANLNLASIYMMRGDLETARKYVRVALAIAPRNPQVVAMARQLGLLS